MLQNSRMHKRSGVRRANVTACMRCRSRKQRCDQRIPSCGSCEQAGTECVSVDLDGKAAPRSYIKELEDKVALLETQLARLPHDLTAAPGTVSSAAALTGLLGDYSQTRSAGQQPPPFYATWLSQAAAIADPSDAAATGLLGEPMAASQLPEGEAARTLLDLYFEHSESFTPIISRAKLELALQSLSSSTRSGDTSLSARVNPNHRFTASIVFATATLLANRKTATLPASRADAYFASAKNAILQDSDATLLYGREIQSVENLALLIQFLLLSARLRPAWYMLGIATRLIVELNLHKLETHDLESEEGVDTCWLFWSVYSFERILCSVLERPVTVPDEAINVALPPHQGLPRRLVSLQLIQQRLMLSEFHTTLLYSPRRNGVMLDLAEWRVDVLRRLQASQTTMAELAGSSRQDASMPSALPGIVSGYNAHLVILVLFPPAAEPVKDPVGITLLASTTYSAIYTYKHLFKTGDLRYYWRTVHHLHRAGCAMMYCVQNYKSLLQQTELSLDSLMESVNVCSAVLWGMTERYPLGARYRDDFEARVALLRSKQRDEDDASPSLPVSPLDFDFFLDVEHLEANATTSF